MRSLALFSIAFAARLAASVTGTVVTSDGTPLPQVKVEAFRPASSMRMFQDAIREPLATAITDKNGAFSLNPSGSSVIEVRVLVDGYFPAYTTAPADEPIGTIALRHASMAEGKVTANGRPVAGAKVWFVRGEGPAVIVTTNADGVYRVADPRSWAQVIFAFHPDFAPAMHPPDSLNFSLEAGKEVHGSVVDSSGHPVAGATVNIDQLQFAKSDAAGKFTFAHVGRESMMLSARSESGAGFARLSGGAATVTLRPVVHVTGVVRDTEKHPLSGVTVASASEAMPDMSVTDANGAFGFTLPRGKYQIYVGETGGYFAAPINIDATGGDVRQDIVARRQTSVEVDVRSEDGKPVAGASVGLLIGIESDIGAPVFAGRVTGVDGSVRMPMSSEETIALRLVAIKPGLPPSSAPVDKSSRGKPVTITIPNGIAISGVVLGKDKKPIGDVRVDPILMAAMPGEMPETATAADAWATTDSEGRFTGRLTNATGGLSFKKKGFMRLQQPIQVQSGMAPVEAQLAAGSSIAGRVVNKDGTPAAEVRVMVEEKTTITAADGSFLLDEIAPGPQLIRFGRIGSKQQSVNAPARDVILVLAPSRSVRGRVIDAATSAPVDKFTVSLQGQGDEMEFGMPAELEGGGEFKIDVPEGAANLMVTAPGFVAAKSVAVPADAKEPIVVRLSHGRTVRGRVVDDSQQPIAGVSFVSMDATTYRDEESAAQTQTGADGSFEITGLNPDEPMRITFEKEGYVRTEWKAQARTDEAPVQIVMRKGLKLSGHVVDGSGTGVANVEVDAMSSGHGAQMSSQQTDDSGAFQFSALAPARYDVTATAMARGQRGEAKDVDIAKVHDITITLQSRPTATIYGHVTGGDSSIRTQVTATSGESDMQTATIDLSGNYRMENAPVGSVEVQAVSYSRRGSHNSKRVAVDVAAGAEARVDLAFAPAVPVHGRVTRGGRPLGGVYVNFYGSGNVIATTGPDGAYDTTVDAGEYDVSIGSVDGEKIPFSKHVVVNDASEINLSVDTAVISAVITDADTGQPIAGAALSASHHGETHTISTSTTAADGTSSLEVSRGELLTITVSRSGYANSSQDLTPADNQTIAMRLVHTPGAVVRIVDIRDGRTLSGYVIARDASGRVLASANETDPDGTVTLPIIPGQYQVSASAEGYGSQTVKASVPSDEIRVPLPRGGNLRLRSTSDARGTARLIQPNGEEYVRCWCSGIAEIKIEGPSTLVDRISPGSYTLEFSKSDGKMKRIAVSIIEGQTAVVSID